MATKASNAYYGEVTSADINVIVIDRVVSLLRVFGYSEPTGYTGLVVTMLQMCSQILSGCDNPNHGYGESTKIGGSGYFTALFQCECYSPTHGPLYIWVYTYGRVPPYKIAI